MKIELLQSDHLSILIKAIRMCWQSQDKSDSYTYLSKDLKEYNKEIWVLGDKDKTLIQNVIKRQHHSTLEHLSYTFEITGISRLVLAELSRHRIASLSVQSTRYTIQKLRNELPFIDDITGVHWERASKYINLIDKESIDFYSVRALDNLRELIYNGILNDEAKYVLPESYKVDLIWSINCRSMMNFLSLRTSKAAHFEIRELANKIYNQIPEDHKFIFDDCIHHD